MNEHADWAGPVVLDNFIWVKGAIYEPPYEVVREAEGRAGKRPAQPTMSTASKATDWMRKKVKQASMKQSGGSLKLNAHKALKMSSNLNFAASSSKSVAKKGTGAGSGVAKKSTGKTGSRYAKTITAT